MGESDNAQPLRRYLAAVRGNEAASHADEAAFVTHAYAWATENGISAQAFVDEGVPLETLEQAGFRQPPRTPTSRLCRSQPTYSRKAAQTEVLTQDLSDPSLPPPAESLPPSLGGVFDGNVETIRSSVMAAQQTLQRADAPGAIVTNEEVARALAQASARETSRIFDRLEQLIATALKAARDRTHQAAATGAEQELQQAAGELGGLLSWVFTNMTTGVAREDLTTLHVEFPEELVALSDRVLHAPVVVPPRLRDVLQAAIRYGNWTAPYTEDGAEVLLYLRYAVSWTPMPRAPYLDQAAAGRS